MSSKKAMGTWCVKPNDNKSVTIGNVLLSEAFFKKYRLDREISSLKSEGVDLAKLAELLVAYKLGDNYGILRDHEFLMEPSIRTGSGSRSSREDTLPRRGTPRPKQGEDSLRVQAQGHGHARGNFQTGILRAIDIVGSLGEVPRKGHGRASDPFSE